MPIRLRAKVNGCSGKTSHSIGTIVNDLPVPVEKIPVPAWVEIIEGEGAFYLLHFNSKGENIADTWHENIKNAKSQAEFEFFISPSDWIEVHDD